ncbi:Protein of unknown function, partial [Cotesia congregata]
MSCNNINTSKPSVIRIINLERTKMIACLCIIFTLVNVAFSQPNFYTHGRYGKREETPPTAGEVNFNFGSRYGRGENIELKATNDKSNELMARVDRFYLGSRYGKRESNNNNLFGSSNGENFIDLNNIQDVLRYFYRLQRRTKQLPRDDVDYIDGENFKSKNDQYIFHKDKFIKWKPSIPKIDSAVPMSSCEQ